MKFYIQITEEHPNENGEYAPIREGSLKLFLDADTKILFTSKPLNNIDKNTPIEFEVDDSLYITNFIARLENSDNYGREPVLDKNLRTQPKLYENPNKPQRLRFRKLNQASANIGIIKAYKKDDITKNFINDISGISNPKNEIYTMDLNQEINLKAFVYERQTTKTNGNITKNITPITPLESANIKWAFKIVNGSYQADSNARSEAFVALGEKQPLNIANKDNKSNNPTNTTKDNINKLDSITDTKSYVVLEHLQGDSITIKLSDIFSDTALESLVNKNIIFFAYNNSPTYCLYTDNELKGNKKIVSQDKITSIELKILKTRFRLEFDGEYLFFYENEREIAKWLARSGVAIDNKANGNEIKPIDRASIPSTDTNKSFYYDSTEQSFLAESDEPYFVTIPANSLIESLKAIKDKSINITNNANQTIANINDDSFKFAENHNENKNINLAGTFSAFIQTLIKHINATESLMIPLKVKYQKRILIMIERFKQTTESTTARMNIYIDRKRVDSSSKIADNAEFNSIYDIATPYAFILERPSPDSIGGELKLRIPEGRYSGAWYDEAGNNTRDNTLNLYNNFVHSDRNVLIHNGNTPKNSDGCLLINKENRRVDNRLYDSLEAKQNFTDLLQNADDSIRQHFNGIDKNRIAKHTEIRIKNEFMPQNNAQETLPPNIIRIETEDESEDFIEIVLPEESMLDNAINIADKVGIIPLPAFKFFKLPKYARSAYRLAKSKSRSLTREEVLEIVDRLEKVLNRKGSDTGIRLVKNIKELNKLWKRLTKNAKELKPDIDKRHGKPIYRRQLDDGTNINYRADSKTGGETIDINSRNPKVNIKIHIDKGM